MHNCVLKHRAKLGCKSKKETEVIACAVASPVPGHQYDVCYHLSAPQAPDLRFNASESILVS